MKKLLVAFALFCSISAFAGSTNIDTSGLSDAAVAELKALAAKKVADTAKEAAAPLGDSTPSTVMTLAATWGSQAALAAEGFAKALSIAAKELGVTVNDFLHTDAGKLTAMLIIWKVAGAAIVHLMFSAVIFITGMIIARVIYMRLFTGGYEKVEYSKFGGFFKGTKMVRIPKTVGNISSDGEWLAFWIMIVTVIATLVFTGVMIA